jgi:transposase InsO family protein
MRHLGVGVAWRIPPRGLEPLAPDTSGRGPAEVPRGQRVPVGCRRIVAPAENTDLIGHGPPSPPPAAAFRQWIPTKFVAPAPNRTWVADFTHVATWGGVVYIAYVVDTFSRRIVGWSAATTKETRLVLDALEMALWQRGRDGFPHEQGELIHHSDAGSQNGAWPTSPSTTSTSSPRRRRPGSNGCGTGPASLTSLSPRPASTSDRRNLSH